MTARPSFPAAGDGGARQPPAAMPTPRERPAAVAAFDAAAASFDERFGEWESVNAQRRAVRRLLLDAFAAGSRLLELGGGTGEDALFLAAEGRQVLLTDGSPAMVARAEAKAAVALEAENVPPTGWLGGRLVELERLEAFAAEWLDGGGARFDGAYSNFAALNCVADLRPVARGLATLLAPGAPALLVVFGPLPPGEVLVELARGRPRSALRRLSACETPARLGGREFAVHYPRPRQIARSFAPWFRLERTHGIGIFVPPSAAEPEISGAPRLLRALEAADRLASRPLALLGDHVLLRLVRTDSPAPAESA